MATVQLRLRGMTPLHAMAAVVSAAPLAWSLFELGIKRARLSPALIAIAAGCALLPWISRGLARAAYRAKCDDVAVHVRGEALPYRTIARVIVEQSSRRHVLRLLRSEDIVLTLVLWDAFAGRLQPLDELERRLKASGHELPR